MATAKKTARGRKRDRARVAGGQDYEVRYEAKKTRRSASAVKKAVKKVGSSRKKVQRRLPPAKRGSAAMADKRVVNRIYRSQSQDTQMVQRARETNEHVLRMLKENPPPDTFLGRKTHEPFPKERKE
jgi:hypothetical protein